MAGPDPAGVGHEHPHDGSHHPHEPNSLGAQADASVRAARVTDAPAIGQVQAVVFTDTYGSRLPADVSAAFDPQAFVKAWRAALSSPPGDGIHRVVVALAGAQVAGFASFGPSQDPDTGQSTGEVTVLAVHPSARRQGHGSRLLNACVDQLRDAGASDLTTWLPADADDIRGFLMGAGLVPDGAFRERVVSPDGDTLREVRLRARLDPAVGEPSPGDSSPGDA